MKTKHFYTVVPDLPEELARLDALARNLWWVFNPDAVRLFQRVSPDLWDASRDNPVKMLAMLPQQRLESLARDEGFIHELDQIWERFQHYMNDTKWFDRQGKAPATHTIAYFSAEFGLARCLPIYSGGLGVLSGDHLKSASDLGIPLVGVGLLYRHGYFRQYLSSDGWQQEDYEKVDIHHSPASLVTRDGAPVLVRVEYPGRTVSAQIWRVQVGRIPLYLLDTHVPENSEEDQSIGDLLYGGDRRMRIQQELLLGVGGARALDLLGIEPVVCHMNEGHSAFLALERIRQVMDKQGLDFPSARAACARGNVFTTHTPVPAGFDLFDPALLEEHITPLLESMSVPFDRILSMGRADPSDDKEPFNMALFAARNANFVNGVSRLHAEVTKKLFHFLTPDTPVHEVPVTAVTNGVHAQSWTSSDMTDLLTRYLGERWTEDPADEDVWHRVHAIPDAELWRVHERRRSRLVTETRRLLKHQLAQRGLPRKEMDVADELLDPEILTIGFARRFATYKRATLLLSDPDRLKRMLTDPDRPVQLLFAGKAHPRDEAGKRLIQRIVEFARNESVRRRIVFLENYEIGVASLLVSGVDLWLNTPRRPMEASGTSGMKVLFNGGLNCSILDGWWDEAFEADLGWAIGAGEDYEDVDYQDQVEGEALYHLLENDVIPTFYERDASGLPRRWIAMMKASMARMGPRFNTHRMVREYHTRLYAPAAEDFHRLASEGFSEARDEAAWSERIRTSWEQVRVESVSLPSQAELRAGSTLAVEAKVQLGGLAPEDVAVEAYAGPVDDHQHIVAGRAYRLSPTADRSPGPVVFKGLVPCDTSGRFGVRVRLRPYRKGLRTLFGPIRWEEL